MPGHITAGQYRAIINRLGTAKTELRKDRLLEYVDSVLEGSEYKGLLKDAQKHIKNIKKANTKLRGRFGDGSELATKLTEIDIRQLTPEELKSFNEFAGKILKNKKAPDIQYLEALVEKFSDRTKEDYDAFEAKLEKAKEDGDAGEKARYELSKSFRDSVDKLDGTMEGVKDAAGYIAAARRLGLARKKFDRLVEEEILSEKEIEEYAKLLGEKDVFSGKYEEQLGEFKKDYVDNLDKMKSSLADKGCRK
jgi:cytochrome c556